MRPPPSISLHNRSFRWLVRSFLTMGSGGMRRTMPKDDVAVIRGEVAVHLAVAGSLALGFGPVRRSLHHGLNQSPNNVR